MKLHQAQSEIARDNHRFRVLVCGRRFGKSMLCTEEIKGRLLHDRMKRINSLDIPEQEKKNIQTMHLMDEYAARVDYFAPTLEDARDLVWGILKRELEPITISINESRLEIVTHNLDGGKSLLRLRSWEKVDNFRGRKTDFVILDEFRKYKNFWIGWEESITPSMSDYLGEGLFLTTPQGFNHVYDLYGYEKKNKDWKSYHFTSYDNPFISRKELEEKRSTMTQDRFAQEYLADFRKTEGLVYPEFDRARHLFDDKTILPEIAKTICGVDFGWTNPASILRIKIDKDAKFWIDFEWYKKQKTTDEIIQMTKQLLPTEVYPDPAEPDRIAEMISAGLNVREVTKDIPAGINRVRELFKQNRIMIHQDCVNLIWELETYRYPDKKPDKNEEEKPVKENDHAVDAMRYALYAVDPQESSSQHNEDFEELINEF